MAPMIHFLVNKLNNRWVVLVFALGLVGAILVSFPKPLEKSIRLDPFLRIESLISRGKFDDALTVLDSLNVSKLDAWDARRVMLQRAVCLMHVGKYDAALALLNGVKKDGTPLADYLAFWQGKSADALGQVDRAVGYYAQVLELSPTSLMRDDAALRAAALSASQGHFKDAAQHYRALLDKSAYEADALAGLVQVLSADGDSAGARVSRLQLIRKYPDHKEARQALAGLTDLSDPEELFYAGIAYRETKNYRQAATLFKRVINDVPDHIWQGRAQYELAQVYYDSRQYRTAEHAYDRAYKVYQVPKALYDLGRCAIKLGQDIRAAKIFLDYAQRYPNVNGASDALWQAAMAYERQNQLRTARKIFIDLAKTYPKSVNADQAAWRAGFALYQIKEYESAAETFLRLADQTDEDYMRDQGYYWVGKCYQKLGKENEAQVWMAKAAKGFPTSYYSARARAVLNLHEDVYPATADSAPLVMGQSYEPSIYLQKGDMLASLGLYRLAQDEYDRALKIHGNNLFALDDLLQRYERIRSMNKALQVSGQIVMLERRQGKPMTLASFRRLYPTYYWGEINQTAQEVDLDPNLMIAIMRQESAFNHEAQSAVGARGLMQVMPSTGKDMALKVKMKDFSPEDLYDPQTSIRLGGQHLSDHLKSFREEDGRRLGLALSAYNAGLNAARRWSRRLPQQDVDEFVETIPYKETRNYVKLVYRNYQVYSYLQNDAVQPIQEQMH